jgi:quinol monooxygenase YgiN
MYAISVMLEIDPDHLEEFKAAAARHAANTKTSEKGCLGFSIYQSPDNPARFYFHELYTDKAAVAEVHAKSPSLAEYTAKTSPWISSKAIEAWNSV